MFCYEKADEKFDDIYCSAGLLRNRDRRLRCGCERRSGWRQWWHRRWRNRCVRQCGRPRNCIDGAGPQLRSVHAKPRRPQWNYHKRGSLCSRLAPSRNEAADVSGVGSGCKSDHEFGRWIRLKTNSGKAIRKTVNGRNGATSAMAKSPQWRSPAPFIAFAIKVSCTTFAL